MGYLQTVTAHTNEIFSSVSFFVVVVHVFQRITYTKTNN